METTLNAFVGSTLKEFVINQGRINLEGFLCACILEFRGKHVSAVRNKQIVHSI